MWDDPFPYYMDDTMLRWWDNYAILPNLMLPFFYPISLITCLCHSLWQQEHAWADSFAIYHRMGGWTNPVMQCRSQLL